MVRVKRTELDGTEVEMEFESPEAYEAYMESSAKKAEKAERDAEKAAEKETEEKEAKLREEAEKAKADVKKISSGIEALIVEARNVGIGPDDLIALFLAKTLSCCK